MNNQQKGQGCVIIEHTHLVQSEQFLSGHGGPVAFLFLFPVLFVAFPALLVLLIGGDPSARFLDKAEHCVGPGGVSPRNKVPRDACYEQ